MIYLHFWANWCSPCISEIPCINQLINDLDSNKIVVANVCLDNEINKWKKILNEKKLSGKNLICEGNWDQIIANMFHIFTIPHYTLVDEKRFIVKNNCKGPDDIYKEIVQLIGFR